MKITLSNNIHDLKISVGQKQLLSLARVILENRKILLLDEATAYVDLKTDQLIQECIKAKFTDCVIISIAHKLLTIADYDRVIVLSSGTVIEDGTPH